MRGVSAWVLWQLVHESLRVRIRQLSLDPNVPGDVVRELRSTEADLELAGCAVSRIGCGSCGSGEQLYDGARDLRERPRVGHGRCWWPVDDDAVRHFGGLGLNQHNGQLVGGG